MAGKIFVTGDIHGEPERFSTTRFPRQNELDKEDYMIICGDFGLVWEGKIEVQGNNVVVENRESDREKWWLDWLEALPFTVLFVDGNHENFDRLKQYQIEEWMGGNEVDYIISHCCPGELHELIQPGMEEWNELTLYFDTLKKMCRYKKWYFGHYHDNKNVTEQDILLYKDILELGASVDENHPVLGKPRYEMYQPVRFWGWERGEQAEKIGLVYIRDPYGTFSNPDEPSYDIMALHGTERCLFKHHPESAVKALTKEEIEEYSELLSELAVKRGK